ncbi:MAG: UDP-N-acetylglucosamine 1-carboxyvinyltransferase [Clostridiales bacterium]|nr:UDP-N-acetylglucosamine 1-carboxyvinyltransferase [Clostridiales bacterium]
MEKMVITGGVRLAGEIRVSGAKNSVLPVLAATVLNGGKNIIKNCPGIKDVRIMLEILEKTGCKAELVGDTIYLDSTDLHNWEIPENLAVEMRSSIILLGPMLARCGKVAISYPGGCEIGPRPIDLHLKALKSMGAEIRDIRGGLIYCKAHKLKGCEIQLDYPSVGATENIILSAVYAEGETLIRNAAKEPEIVDLQEFLIKGGAEINGAGTDKIWINGKQTKLSGVEHTIIPDRITAGTYMAAAAATRGDVLVRDVVPEHLSSIISLLKESGCDLDIGKDSIRVKNSGRNDAVNIVRTLPYPGFPTDMQPQIVALLSVAKGTSIVIETVFENRLRHVEELGRMGADITLEGRLAVIKGVSGLHGASVNAGDLRGGAALVISGLIAEGETSISGVHHIDRGYETIEHSFAALGAKIRRQ